MNKTIKIEISIKNEFQTGFRAEMIITDMVFTEYSNLLNYDHLADCYKKAMRKLESFTMLTATLLIYDRWSIDNHHIVSSFRYTNKYGETKKSIFNGNSYNNFVDESAKNILKDIKQMVETGNREYIELIKLKTA